jgi:Tfp pilus assembly protein PilN
MSQVNLLPREILQRQRMRQLTTLIIVAGAVLVGLIFLFYLLQIRNLSTVNDEIEAQERTNASIQAQIDQLQEFGDLQEQAQASEELLASAYAGEVSFSGILMDVSQIMPGAAYLNNLAVSLSGSSEDTASEFIGTISADGQAVNLDTIADWLTRLGNVDGWENPWLNTASEGDNGFTFATGVDLSPEVETPRGKGEVDGG